MAAGVARTIVAPLRGGRPRLLTLDQVVDGALEVGLDRFNMAMVAEHLGVGVATLYQYVSGRDELLRRAVARQLALLPLPRDVGQHWAVYLRQYALALQEALASEPRAIAQFAESGFDFETELEMVRGFLAALTGRGFAVAEAARIVRHTGFIALGAAVGVSRERAAAAKGEAPVTAIGRAIDRAGVALPLMREAANLYAASTATLAADLLQPLIESIARARGEDLERKGLGPKAPAGEGI